MGKYGDASLRAVDLIHQKSNLTPIKAWGQAVSEIPPKSKSSINKGCPKNAFLGLCEEGKIKGVSRGSYIKSQKNKNYALDALSILEKDPSSSWTPISLWGKIENGGITHNNQMDVVIALFQEGLTQ